MSIYAVKSKEEWLRILNDLHQESGMVVGVANTDGDVLHIAGDRPMVCAKVRENEDALKYICSRTHNAVAEEAKATGKPVIDFCEAGMVKVVIPFYRDEEWRGNVSLCGCLDEAEEVETFIVEKNLNTDEGTVQSWFDKMPKTTSEKVEALVEKIVKTVS